jgi:hypothetical protein
VVVRVAHRFSFLCVFFFVFFCRRKLGVNPGVQQHNFGMNPGVQQHNLGMNPGVQQHQSWV